MKKKLLITLLVLVLAVAGLFAWCAFTVEQAGKGRLYDRVDAIPAREYGLVLGTSKHRPDGGPNPFFLYRIDAAAKLYHAGKVKILLVSGDNHTQGYNEPVDMRDALIAQGVPSGAIKLDYAGFRTLDSIDRAKRIFGLKRFTIISQRDHDDRALLIAEHDGLDTIAYAADDVDFHYAPKAHIHEWLAEVKVVLDLYVLHTKPKYLGKPEDI
jgi:SanA protein